MPPASLLLGDPAPRPSHPRPEALCLPEWPRGLLRVGPKQILLPRPQGHRARNSRFTCRPLGFGKLVFWFQNRMGGGFQKPCASLVVGQPGCPLPQVLGSFLSPASGFSKPHPAGTLALWLSGTLKARAGPVRPHLGVLSCSGTERVRASSVNPRLPPGSPAALQSRLLFCFFMHQGPLALNSDSDFE